MSEAHGVALVAAGFVLGAGSVFLYLSIDGGLRFVDRLYTTSPLGRPKAR